MALNPLDKVLSTGDARVSNRLTVGSLQALNETTGVTGVLDVDADGNWLANGSPLGGGGGSAVTSVNGDTGVVVLTASDVGALAVDGSGNVDINGVLALGALADVEAAIAAASGGGGSLPADATFETVFASASKASNNIVTVKNTNGSASRTYPPLLVENTGTGGIGVRTTGDTRARVSLAADGEVNFSDGSAAFDVGIVRSGGGQLTVQAGDYTQFTGALVANGQIVGSGSGKTALQLTSTAATPGITIRDANLYRVATNSLRTDSNLDVAGVLSTSLQFRHRGTTLAFYDVDPTPQHVAIANPTDDASNLTATTEILNTLRSLGLIAL